MRYLKKISIFALAVCLILSACLISCGSKAQPSDDMEEIYVIKTEIKDGHLWITYSDSPTAPKDAGKVDASYEGTEGLDFHLLPNGTYGVSVGTADRLEEIIIPPTYNGKAVTKIIRNGFSGNLAVKKMVLPVTITEIENNGFLACTSLEEISLPGVNTIGEFAFTSCSSLKTITLSDKLEIIRSFAFSNTISLREIVIPKSVKTIGRDIFSNTADIAVKCEAEQMPEDWDEYWASDIETIIWGYKG